MNVMTSSHRKFCAAIDESYNLASLRYSYFVNSAIPIGKPSGYLYNFLLVLLFLSVVSELRREQYAFKKH